MAQRKYLTFKKLDPRKVKLIVAIFAVLFVVSPGVRYNTGEAFHLVGNMIQSTTQTN